MKEILTHLCQSLMWLNRFIDKARATLWKQVWTELPPLFFFLSLKSPFPKIYTFWQEFFKAQFYFEYLSINVLMESTYWDQIYNEKLWEILEGHRFHCLFLFTVQHICAGFVLLHEKQRWVKDPKVTVSAWRQHISLLKITPAKMCEVRQEQSRRHPSSKNHPHLERLRSNRRNFGESIHAQIRKNEKATYCAISKTLLSFLGLNNEIYMTCISMNTFVLYNIK